jgi:uncharacterized delta-60 repeat protein
LPVGATSAPTTGPGEPTPVAEPTGAEPTGAEPTGAEPTGAEPTGPPVEGLHISGIVSGLEGTGLVVYALGEELPILQNGPFQFTQPLPDGIPYQLRVITQPRSPAQACKITNGKGTLFGADVTDVLIDCVTVTTSTSLDPAFGAGGKVTTVLEKGQGEAMAIQPADRKIVVAGRALGDGSFDFAVLRYLPTGSLDTGFGDGGVATMDVSAGGNDEAYGVAIQTDGKIVLVGMSRVGLTDDFAVARFNADGTIDKDFGTAGGVTTDFNAGPDSANAVAIDKNGGIVVAGNAQQNPQDNDFGVARYTKAGVLDSLFGSGGKLTTNIAGNADLAFAIALTANEEIVVAGRVAPRGGDASDFGLVRYASDGTLDAGFGEGGIVRTDFNGNSDDVPNGLVVDGDTVIAAGYALGTTSSDFAMARYRGDGKLDPGFGKGGLVTTDFGVGEDYGQAVALGPNRVIAVVGQATSSTITDLAIALYSSKGVLDTTFGTGGLVTVDFYGSGDIAKAVAFDADAIAAAGYVGNGSTTEVVLVKTLP